MLNSSKILTLNVIYSKALNTLKNGKTAKIQIGTLSKSVELVYIVCPNSIELGVCNKTAQCKILTPTDLNILRSQFNKEHIVQMIDIAERLNQFSVFKPKNIENCISLGGFVQ